MAQFKMICFDKRTGEIFNELVWNKNVTDENVYDKTMEFNLHFFKQYLFKNPYATLHIIPVTPPKVELPLFNQNCF